MRVTARGDTTSLADRKRRAGQRLLLRWGATQVTDDLRHVIAEIGPAGFVVEPHNALEAAQLRELTRELADLVDPHHPALVWTTSPTPVPESSPWPTRAVPWSDEPDAARALARELRALGLDLLGGSGPTAPTAALLRALADEHVCLVPGPIETPRGTPSPELTRLLASGPSTLRAGPDLDLLERGLRRVGEFGGVLVLDHPDQPDRPVLALQATVDLELAPPDHEAQLRQFAALVRLQEHDRGAERACQHSTARVHQLREELFLEVPPRPALDQVGDPDHLVFAKLLTQRYATE